MKATEVEFKYRAEDISLNDFMKFCEGRKPFKSIIASGWDHFYESPLDTTGFYRYRVGPDCNQLTYKRKTQTQNNFVRKEHNLDLAASFSVEQGANFCEDFGYVHNFTIFKNCFVFTYDWYTLVYYVCYDTDMKELGRFMEIEMAEDYAWANQQDAWDQLVAMERIAKPLGINPQCRVKRSLFELFRKGDNK